MNSSLPEILQRTNNNGQIEYTLRTISDWEGFDSFIEYLQLHWKAEISESVDWVYSRRWVLHLHGVPISVYHDSQIGNYFLREDGIADQSLLEAIKKDLIESAD